MLCFVSREEMSGSHGQRTSVVNSFSKVSPTAAHTEDRAWKICDRFLSRAKQLACALQHGNVGEPANHVQHCPPKRVEGCHAFGHPQIVRAGRLRAASRRVSCVVRHAPPVPCDTSDGHSACMCMLLWARGYGLLVVAAQVDMFLTLPLCCPCTQAAIRASAQVL